MCGRYALATTWDHLQKHFGFKDNAAFGLRYNIAPGQIILAITAEKKPVFMHWGFKPRWASDTPEHINVRLETAHLRPTFKESFEKRRCLIPATGYFEWVARQGRKQPYFIGLAPAQVFSFAAIWTPSGDPLVPDSVAILTQEACAELKPLHDRQPVILQSLDYGLWLEKGVCIDRPGHSDRRWASYAVSPQVNRPAFDSRQCVEPLSSF